MSRGRVAALALLCLPMLACHRGYETLEVGAEQLRGEEAGIAARMIDAVQEVSLQRHPDGKILRFNQSKGHGCLRGQLQVNKQLSPQLAQGLFAEAASFDAILRFASATQFDDEEKDFRGLSIKVLGVEGDTPWGTPGTQDFLYNSHPGLFAATPGDFLSFVEATRDDKIWRYFINPAHWYSLGPILRGRDTTDDLFSIRYFSTTAFRHGDTGTAVKHAVRQCPETAMDTRVDKGKDFLSKAMAARLAQGPVCLEMMVQFQTDPGSMPVENASIVWDEEASPFQSLATITIPDQDFQAEQDACEAMSFNPWQALEAHRPLGGINRVRRAVYEEAAEFRAEENQRRGLM